MNFAQALQNYPFILAEGAIIERLRRDPAMTIDPHIANGGLIYSEAGRTALRRIYTQYLDIGKAYNLPMITLTPTWRATRSGCTGPDLRTQSLSTAMERASWRKPALVMVAMPGKFSSAA
jgi:hypothetical protein